MILILITEDNCKEAIETIGKEWKSLVQTLPEDIMVSKRYTVQPFSIKDVVQPLSIKDILGSWKLSFIQCNRSL